MAVLLALCPQIVVGTQPLSYLSDEDGARRWVWQRLRCAGRGGLSEAVRVFEKGQQVQGETTVFSQPVI